jgi:hypothetical protein
MIVMESVSEEGQPECSVDSYARTQQRQQGQGVAEHKGERDHDRSPVAPAQCGTDYHPEHLAD